MTVLRGAMIGSVLLMLAGGCSLLGRGDDPTDYTMATVSPPLVIPDGLGSDTILDRLVVPDVSGPENHLDHNVPRPSALSDRDVRQNAKIQKLGDRRWLILNEPPAAIWPRLRRMLEDNAIPVVREDPDRGIMETDWVGVAAGEPGKGLQALLSTGADPGFARVRFRLDQGLGHDTSELHITQQYVPQAESQADGDWPRASTTPGIETKLLQETGGWLAAQLGQAGAISLRAGNITNTPRSDIRRDDGGLPYLYLRLGLDRAWATVAQALARAGVTVEEVRTQQSLFLVRASDRDLNPTKDGGGGLRRMVPFLSSGDQRLEVHLREGDFGYFVAVTAVEQAPVDVRVVEKMLILIRDNAG